MQIKDRSSRSGPRNDPLRKTFGRPEPGIVRVDAARPTAGRRNGSGARGAGHLAPGPQDPLRDVQHARAVPLRRLDERRAEAGRRPGRQPDQAQEERNALSGRGALSRVVCHRDRIAQDGDLVRRWPCAGHRLSHARRHHRLRRHGQQHHAADRSGSNTPKPVRCRSAASRASPGRCPRCSAICIGSCPR